MHTYDTYENNFYQRLETFSIGDRLSMTFRPLWREIKLEQHVWKLYKELFKRSHDPVISNPRTNCGSSPQRLI